MRTRAAAPLMVLMAALTGPVPAHAGRVLATGHPLDRACAAAGTSTPEGGCHALRVTTDWVRGTAPDPSKPLLLLQPSNGSLQAALSPAWPGTSPPSVQVLDPSSTYALQVPITPEAFSAVLVASDGPDGGSAPIPPAVRTHVRAFFDQGGGVLLLGGAGTELLPVGVRRATTGGPNAVTAAGQTLGLTAGDAACCPALHAFAEPTSATALKVAERDAGRRAVTVFGTGFANGGEVGPTPIDLPASRTCASRRRFTIHVRRLLGLRYRRVEVRVEGRPAKVVTGRRIRSTIDLRGLPRGRYRVSIVATTTDGRVFRGTRTYNTCRGGRLAGGRPPL